MFIFSFTSLSQWNILVIVIFNVLFCQFHHLYNFWVCFYCLIFLLVTGHIFLLRSYSFLLSLLFSHLVLSDFLATPWAAHWAPLFMVFPRQQYWTGLPFPSLGHFPRSRFESKSPALVGRFFSTEPPQEAQFLMECWMWFSVEYWILSFFLKVLDFSCQEVQSLSRVWLFVTPWTAAGQASLFITSSQSLLRLMSIELVMPSSHLILCHPLLLLTSIFPSSRVFSNESVLHIRWPKYWSFSFSISPSSEHPGLISFRMDWLDLLAVQGTLKSLLQHHSSKASILQLSGFFIV